jgi:hypothetical protein
MQVCASPVAPLEQSCIKVPSADSTAAKPLMQIGLSICVHLRHIQAMWSQLVVVEDLHLSVNDGTVPALTTYDPRSPQFLYLHDRWSVSEIRFDANSSPKAAACDASISGYLWESSCLELCEARALDPRLCRQSGALSGQDASYTYGQIVNTRLAITDPPSVISCGRQNARSNEEGSEGIASDDEFVDPLCPATSNDLEGIMHLGAHTERILALGKLVISMRLPRSHHVTDSYMMESHAVDSSAEDVHYTCCVSIQVCASWSPSRASFLYGQSTHVKVDSLTIARVRGDLFKLGKRCKLAYSPHMYELTSVLGIDHSM